MMNTSRKFKLGLFVVSAVVLLLVGLIFVTGTIWRGETFAAYTLLEESVQGLEIGSPVRFRGVSIGRVKRITIEKDELEVRVDMELYQTAMRFKSHQAMRDFLQKQIHRGARCRLQLSGLTGMKYVEIDFYANLELLDETMDESLPAEKDYDIRPAVSDDSVLYIPAVPSLIAGITSDMAFALMKISRIDFQEISDRLSETLSAMNQLLNQENLQDLMQHLNQTMAQLNKIMERVDAQLKDRQLEQTVEQLNSSMESIDQLAQSAKEQIVRLDLPALQNKLEDVLNEYQDLPNETKQLLTTSEEALNEIRRLSERLAAAADKIQFEELGESATATLREIQTTLEILQRSEDDVTDVLRNLARAAAAFAEAGENIRQDPSVLLRGRRAPSVDMGEE